MYTITILLKNPSADLLAVKEALAYYCEAYGDIKLISVTSEKLQQENLFEKGMKL